MLNFYMTARSFSRKEPSMGNQSMLFNPLEERWLDFFETNQVKTYGVRGKGPLDYYHPSPKLALDQAAYLE
jgi:hypothetical protein